MMGERGRYSRTPFLQCHCVASPNITRQNSPEGLGFTKNPAETAHNYLSFSAALERIKSIRRLFKSVVAFMYSLSFSQTRQRPNSMIPEYPKSSRVLSNSASMIRSPHGIQLFCPNGLGPTPDITTFFRNSVPSGDGFAPPVRKEALMRRVMVCNSVSTPSHTTT